MGAMNEVSKIANVSVPDVDFHQDRGTVLSQLQSVRQALLQLFNQYNSIDLNKVISEILSNIEQPLPNVRLYDPIFAHSVLHPPFELNVVEKDKVSFGEYPVPQLGTQEMYFQELLPDFPDIEFPDVPMPLIEDVPEETGPPAEEIPPGEEPYPYTLPEPAPGQEPITVKRPNAAINPGVSPAPEPIPVNVPSGEPSPSQDPYDYPSRVPNTDTVRDIDEIRLPAGIPDRYPDEPPVDNPVRRVIEENFPHPFPSEPFNVVEEDPDNRDIVVRITPDTIWVHAVDVNTGEVLSTANTQYERDLSYRTFILDGAIASLVAAGASTYLVGKTATALRDVNILTRLTGSTPCIITEPGGIEKALSFLGKVYMEDRLMSYIRSIQDLAKVDPVRGYKLALILAYAFPNYLEVGPDGAIYVSRKWENAQYFFSGDVYNLPIFIPPAELFPFIYVGNEPFSRDIVPPLEPNRVYSRLFDKEIREDIEYYLTKYIVKPWSVLE